MANELLHTPSDVVRHLLIRDGLGTLPTNNGSWPVYDGDEPDLPDNCITISTTQGDGPGRSQIDGEILGCNAVQVRVRSALPTVGWLKADSIQSWMSRSVYYEELTIGSGPSAARYLIESFTRIGDVLPLGRETPTSSRRLHTLNAFVSITQR